MIKDKDSKKKALALVISFMGKKTASKMKGKKKEEKKEDESDEEC
jgi:hypothetical protein